MSCHHFLVTVTIGLGTAIREATFDALFAAADQALWEGKKKGRKTACKATSSRS